MSDRVAADLASVFDKEVRTTDDLPRRFERLTETSYELTVDYAGISFLVDYIRRERNQWMAELRVRCSLPGVRTYKGTLSHADFNLSSATVRQRHAKLLETRSECPAVPWDTLLEELCQRVIESERQGSPAQILRDLEKPPVTPVINIDGIPVLMNHPMIWFGDGSTAKSYAALYFAGRLSIEHGVRVGLFDWELAGEDHRDRLECLFGSEMPDTRYVRCSRPFIHEADRLRRIVRDEALDYVILDSISFACDGPPEAAESAERYFKALRQLGVVGSLSIAHISKAEGADHKPFGSAMWHNGARSTWNVKLASEDQDSNSITVGFYHRKANMGKLQRAVGFEIAFEVDKTAFKKVDLRDVPDLAAKMPLSQRIRDVLVQGAITKEGLCEQLDDANEETVSRMLRRDVRQGRVLRFPGPGGDKYGLPSRQDD